MSGDSVTKGGVFGLGEGAEIREAEAREEAAHEAYVRFARKPMSGEEIARSLGLPTGAEVAAMLMAMPVKERRP